ncbi:MAG: hypothetical protein WBA93_24375 [Microcoleaceae cyanobacterium]
MQLTNKSPLNINSKFILWMTLILAIIPAIVLGLLIFKYSVNVPITDQWQIAAIFKKINEGTVNFSDLIAQHNESRKFFPRLIFIGLAYLTNWNVKYEMLVIFLLSCVVSVNIYRLNKLTVDTSTVKVLFITFISNILIFSPIQYENWLWGIQIVVFIPIVCITTSILIAYSRLHPTAKFLICMLLATISSFSYANGLLCWVIVLPVLALAKLKTWSELLKNKWLYLLWIFGFLTNISLYFYNYHQPISNPGLAEVLNYPYQTLQYFFAFLGAPLGLGISTEPLNSSVQAVNNSIILGIVIFTIFTCLFVYLLRHIRETYLMNRTIGWLMIGFYGIISAAVTSGGRVTFGLDTALSSRYTTFSTYLIVAIIGLISIVGADWKNKGYSFNKNIFNQVTCWLLGVVTVLQIQTFTYSFEQMRDWHYSILKYKSCLLLIDSMQDNCKNVLRPYYYDVWKQRAHYLTEIGFLNPGLIKTNKIKDLVNIHPNSKNEITGVFEKVDKIGDRIYLASGWAALTLKRKSVDSVILTYDNSAGEAIIFAVVDGTISRPDIVASHHQAGYIKSGWQKIFTSAEFLGTDVNIRAWAFDTNTTYAYPLSGVHIIKERSRGK